MMPAVLVAAGEAGLPAREGGAEGFLVVGLDALARRVGFRQDASDLVVMEPAIRRRVGGGGPRPVTQDMADDAGAEGVVLDGHGVREPDVVDPEGGGGGGVEDEAPDAKQGFSRPRGVGVGGEVAFETAPVAGGVEGGIEGRDGPRDGDGRRGGGSGVAIDHRAEPSIGFDGDPDAGAGGRRGGPERDRPNTTQVVIPRGSPAKMIFSVGGRRARSDLDHIGTAV